MKLLHGTDSDSAKSILGKNQISPSQFDLLKYFTDFCDSQSLKKLPGNLKNQHVMWLGKGVYAFEFTDSKSAHYWRQRYNTSFNKKYAVIQINCDIKYPKQQVLNMSTKNGKQLIQNFLINDLFNSLKETYKKILKPDEFTKQYKSLLIMYKFLANDTKAILKEDFCDISYILGILIELMIEYNHIDIKSYPIIKATFTKKIKGLIYLDTYVCIKDLKVINKLEDFPIY